MLGLSLATEEKILREIPTRGYYAAVKQNLWHRIVWRHAGNERTLVSFIDSPHKALKMAADLNFVHIDEHTGETTRNWESLKISWWNGKKETSRLVLPAGFIG